MKKTNKYNCLLSLIILSIGCGRMEICLTGNDIGIETNDSVLLANKLKYMICEATYCNPGSFGMNRHHSMKKKFNIYLKIKNISNDTMVFFFNKDNFTNNEFKLYTNYQENEIIYDMREWIGLLEKNLLFPKESLFFLMSAGGDENQKKLKKNIRNLQEFKNTITNSVLVYEIDSLYLQRFKDINSNYLIIRKTEFKFSKDTEISYYW